MQSDLVSINLGQEGRVCRIWARESEFIGHCIWLDSLQVVLFFYFLLKLYKAEAYSGIGFLLI